VTLAWRRGGDGWVARSAEGSKARIYPLGHSERETYVLEVDLGDKTFWKGVDACAAISASPSPVR
jgi:hypothetical protein